LLPAVLWGANTTVTRTVVGPDGHLASGTVYIRISAACVSGSSYVTEQTKVVRFKDGDFSVSLVPNDTCVPAGTSYTVGWTIGNATATETWVVPTSSVPVTVASVIVTAPPVKTAVRDIPQPTDPPIQVTQPAAPVAITSPLASVTVEIQHPHAREPAAPAQTQPTNLLLTVGKSLIIDSDLALERVSIGLGDIAESTVIGPHELLLNAKAPGETSLIVWREGGSRRFYELIVEPSRLMADNRVEGIRRELEAELPGQHIDLSVENDSAFLRGTVRDVTSADRAVAIASILGKTINLLYVEVPPPEAQILLKVKFASVDRNISTQLGLNIVSTGAANTVGSTSTQQFSPVTFGAVPGNPVTATLSDALNLFFFRSDLNLGATIEALEVKGLLQVLSEPNILAENGVQASFLAGGEFPFPSVSAGTGGTPTVSIQFREYGIRLTFLPTITPRGTIQMQVAPEVSALDFTNGLQISGFNVPALTTRKIDTQVELRDGQSFAIGGLLDNRTTETFEKIPFIGDIPILGKLFQSKVLSKQNTELIVIVTPELVRPIPAGQPVPSLNYPTPFLKPNTGKDLTPVPAADMAGATPAIPPNPAIPIEVLIKSLQPAPAQPAVAPAATAKPPAVPVKQ
jgi:pilus assembly protein CpaC